MELEVLIAEMKRIIETKDVLNLPIRMRPRWWKAIFGIVRDAWKSTEQRSNQTADKVKKDEL